MRNLYRWLGLGASAAAGEILAVLPRAPTDVQEDVRVVLLNAARRKIYDDNHAVLSRIALLRARLGLEDTPHWNGETAIEFRELVAAPLKRPSPTSSGRTASGKDGTFKVLLLFCLAVPAYVWLNQGVLRNNPPPKFDFRPSTPVTPSSSPSLPSSDIPALLRAPSASTASPPSLVLPPEEPLPRAGVVSRVGRAELIAPLNIITEGPEHHVVKLVDVAGNDVMLVFVPAGATLKVYVPIGQFELRYGAGMKWYGKKLTFGRSGSYSRADTMFDFKRSGTKISGYTVTLYKVQGGNMPTAPISAEAF